MVHLLIKWLGFELTLLILLVLRIESVEEHAEILSGLLAEVIVDVNDGIEVELGFWVGLEIFQLNDGRFDGLDVTFLLTGDLFVLLHQPFELLLAI